MEKVKIGIIGCGVISEIYLENLTRKFHITEVEAVADLVPERAKARAESYHVRKACSVEELLRDPEIQIVLNLTIPKAHAEVGLAVLQAGKHLYTEKPLSISRRDGQKILALARKKGLLVGGAPDTFLGGSLQTCRKLIDDGEIGEPLAAFASMTCPGHERWHPEPDFYYKEGGGPMLDVGPYYITALVHLIGPVAKVSGFARKSYPERTITSQPHYGKKIGVDVPTHVSGSLQFENGAIGTIITSFDIWGARLPRIEIYGSKGSLSVPDPNHFSGEIKMLKAREDEWRTVPPAYGFTDNNRGLGLADMATAVRSGRKHRANGDMTFHVLDTMQGILESSVSGREYAVESSCDRPEPFPAGLTEHEVDA